jgi:hypothetical protein
VAPAFATIHASIVAISVVAVLPVMVGLQHPGITTMVDSLKLVPVSVIVCVVEASSVVGVVEASVGTGFATGSHKLPFPVLPPPWGGVTISK